MKSYDRRGVAWPIPIYAAAIAAGIVGSGCTPAGAASARQAASPLPVSIGLAQGETELGADGESPGNASTTARLPPAARESGGDGEERRRTVVFVGAATAGLTAVAGVSFAIVARVKSLDADDKQEELSTLGGSSACAGGQRAGDCIALRRLRADAAMFLTMTTWSLLSAGVIELAIGIYGGAAPRAKAVRSLRVSPAVGPQGAVMAVTGVF